MQLIDFVGVFGVVVTLIGVVFVGRQTYAHFIRSKAFSYIERFNSQEFMELRIAIDQWLVLHKDPQTMIDVLSSERADDIEVSIKIRTFLNIFQELAVAYEKGMIDKHIFFRNFDYLILSNWDKFADFIYSVRAANNDFSIYKRFELMVNDVRKFKRRDRGKNKTYVFGYGSLMLPESIHNTLQRQSNKYSLYDVTLHGYERSWDIMIPVFSDRLQKKIDVLFLNITKNENSTIDGKMLEVDDDELEKLSAREVNYNCIEITKDVENSHPIQRGDTVLTFIGEEKHLLKESAEKVYVMQNYLGIIDRVKTEFPKYERAFDATFEAEVLEGKYSFKV